MNTPKRRVSVLVALVALFPVIFLLASLMAGAPAARAQGARPGQGQAPAPPPFFPKPDLPGETAGQHYDNIKVLKDIPAERLIPSMQYIAMSLGVQCNYCHVQGAFEKDDKKPKQIARKMMAMVMDINRTNFDRDPKVECYTCHNGSPVPRTVPPVVELGMRPAPMIAGERVPGEPGPPVPPKPVESLPSPEQLITKYEQAIGGSRLASLTAKTVKGTFEAGRTHGQIEQTFKAPDKSYIMLRTEQGQRAQGFDGTAAWVQNPAGRVRELVTVRGFDLRREADFFRTLDLNKSYDNFHDVAKAKVADKDAYLVMADEANGPGTDQLYFDASSGLLVRVVQFTPSAFGEIPTQYDYSDFRDVSGVKVPFEVRFGKPDALTMYHFTEIKFNEPVEDSRFSRPADKPPATASR